MNESRHTRLMVEVDGQTAIVRLEILTSASKLVSHSQRGSELQFENSPACSVIGDGSGWTDSNVES